MKIETFNLSHVIRCTQLATRLRTELNNNSFPALNFEVETLHEMVAREAQERKVIDETFQNPERRIALVAHDKITARQRFNLKDKDTLFLAAKSNGRCATGTTQSNFLNLNVLVKSASTTCHATSYHWRVMGIDDAFINFYDTMPKILERGLRMTIHFK